MGCSCLSFWLHSCTSAPITDRKQLKLIPESKLNAQAAAIYEKVKEKEKMSDDLKTLMILKKLVKKLNIRVNSYFDRENLIDPTLNFDWEYILIDNDKLKCLVYAWW